MQKGEKRIDIFWDKKIVQFIGNSNYKKEKDSYCKEEKDLYSRDGERGFPGLEDRSHSGWQTLAWPANRYFLAPSSLFYISNFSQLILFSSNFSFLYFQFQQKDTFWLHSPYSTFPTLTNIYFLAPFSLFYIVYFEFSNRGELMRGH